jgi:putative serine protease PepD
VWPVVAVLAVVLGVGGGFAGAELKDRLDRNEPTVAASPSLDASSIVTTPPLAAKDTSVVKVAAALLPSTVQVLAEYQGVKDGASGSGFILDNRGHVITNNHVVSQSAGDSGPIEVVDRDGTRYAATLVGRSSVYDIAVLRVPAARRLKPASLGSAERLQVGQTVVAIGSPLGLSSTVTEGIVSALHRPVTTGASSDTTSYINAVQTDAAINPGNSGGPLVDLLGQVVGVNSAIATTGAGAGQSGNIGVGFAIPIDQVKVTAEQILETGHATYPVVGARVDTVTTNNTTGARIDRVDSGSPAARAGLRTGDRVIRLNGQRVTNGVGLIVAIRAHQPGETVTLTIVRDGRTFPVPVTLGSHSDP